MRPNSPSAIFTSLILHGFAAAMLLVTTMFVARQNQVVPVIFELVAGPPTAPDALVAPAKGNTLALVVPKTPEVKAEPEPKAAVAPPPKPDPVVPKPASKTPPRTSTYQEFLKSQPKARQPAAPPPRRTAKAPQIDVKGIIGGVKGGSTDNTRGGQDGKALTREEHSQLDTYISLLIQELKKAHEPPSGVSDKLATKVTFDITASGAILNPRISKSSGNREFDESVLEAFRRVRSIGPTPNRRPDTWEVTFRMRDVD